MSKAQQSKSKNNRPNFLWVYAIIGIIFMGIWVVTGQFAPQPEKINRNEVKAMLENQWVKRVVLVNDRNVEVSLKSQAELDTMASVIQAERDSLLTALSDSKASLEAQLIQLADSSKTEDLAGDSTSEYSAEDEGVEEYATELQFQADRIEREMDSIKGLDPLEGGKAIYKGLDIEDVGLIGDANLGPHFTFTISSQDEFEKEVKDWQSQFPAEEQVSVEAEIRESFFTRYGWLLFFVLMMGLWFFFMRRMAGGGVGGGGQIFNVGKSKAQLFDKDTAVKVTFDSVAGLEGAKEEVVEIVSFLKDPKKYTSLGGKIPKGALLVGEPGTGKTLLAKAMAGEAKVPFFSISGSDFVEMFVGVGASRVRDLFKQAREKAPCIIFIDEIDAIGRARGRGMMQANDERENTLNQLLVEMDGFSSDKGVIILAATNRPDVLDNALKRPGRFDRQIMIDKPDLKSREEIFQVHLKAIKTGENVDANKLAAMTPGFVGADIANICNEAALIAARRDKTSVEMDDFNAAVDRVIGGLEKKHKIISKDEKEVIAYHEAGHAVSSWFLQYANPLVKVSIVPRGRSLGAAWYLPDERNITNTEQLEDEMAAILAGRAAEEIVFGKISTGAQNDLDRVTKMAYSMVVVFGMSEKVGNVSYYDMLQQNNLSKPYSDATAEAIDAEIRAIIDRQYARVKKLLETKREELNTVAQELLENEMIYRDRVVELIGESPFAKKTEEEEVKPAEDSTQCQEGSEVSMPEAQDDNAETGPSTQKEDSTSTEEKL
ncbi:MAG: ATP-dependent zinc metalloprotease FtsH [Chitinophagales bacterium]